MKIRAVAVIVASLIVFSSAPSRAVAVRRTAPLPVSIPFELATHHVIITVSVNTSRPLSFVLDTGAAKAIIRMDVAKELGLSLHGNLNARGAGGGTQAGRFVKNATWSLVGLDGFVQPVAMALPLPELPHAFGRDVHGIIGGEFIKQFVLELDYQARTLTLHDRATFAYSGRGDMLPLDFNADGHPVLKATVTPLNGQPLERPFLLDIGSGQALVLHSPFVAAQNLLGPLSKTIRATGAAGVGGRTSGRVGRVAALQIGSFTIQDPITMFAQDTAGAFANPLLAGNIGAQIIRRFRAFFDYGRARIILEPSSAFADPFDRAFSGLSLRAEGPDYRTFRVRDVLEQSPASDAGIAVGDVILSVGDKRADSLTLSMIHEILEKPAPYELTIRRGERLITVTLTPRRLI